MKPTDINKSRIYIDRRYIMTLADGRTLNRRGSFLMACDPTNGWHLDTAKLAQIVSIVEI